MNTMIYTERLDKGIRTAATVHERAGQHRKGTIIPYAAHPFGVMLIASAATKDEDTLIACLLHDVLEDVSPKIYSEADMRTDFGKHVVSIVKDVTKNDLEPDWHLRGAEYLDHLRNRACDEAVIVSTSDKIHNLLSILTDYKTEGNALWQRFSTKSGPDQLWWYSSILNVATERQAPPVLLHQLGGLVSSLETIVQAA